MRRIRSVFFSLANLLAALVILTRRGAENRCRMGVVGCWEHTLVSTDVLPIKITIFYSISIKSQMEFPTEALTRS
jgi:hypothetical protein